MVTLTQQQLRSGINRTQQVRVTEQIRQQNIQQAEEQARVDEQNRIITQQNIQIEKENLARSEAEQAISRKLRGKAGLMPQYIDDPEVRALAIKYYKEMASTSEFKSARQQAVEQYGTAIEKYKEAGFKSPQEYVSVKQEQFGKFFSTTGELYKEKIQSQLSAGETANFDNSGRLKSITSKAMGVTLTPELYNKAVQTKYEQETMQYNQQSSPYSVGKFLGNDYLMLGGVVKPAPTLKESYMEVVNTKRDVLPEGFKWLGYVSGVQETLSSEVVRAKERGEIKLYNWLESNPTTKGSYYPYYSQQETGGAVGFAVDVAPYFIPWVGEGLLITSGTEAVVRKDTTIPEKALGVVGVGAGILGLKYRINDAFAPKTLPSATSKVQIDKVVNKNKPYEPPNPLRELRIDKKAIQLRKTIGLDKASKFYRTQIVQPIQRIGSNINREIKVIERNIGGEIIHIKNKVWGSPPRLNPQELSEASRIRRLAQREGGILGLPRGGTVTSQILKQERLVTEATQKYTLGKLKHISNKLIGTPPKLNAEEIAFNKLAQREGGILGLPRTTLTGELLTKFKNVGQATDKFVLGKLKHISNKLIGTPPKLNAEELYYKKLGESKYGILGNEPNALFPKLKTNINNFNQELMAQYNQMNKISGKYTAGKIRYISDRSKGLVIEKLKPIKKLVVEKYYQLNPYYPSTEYGLLGNKPNSLFPKLDRFNEQILSQYTRTADITDRSYLKAVANIKNKIGGIANKIRFEKEILNRAINPKQLYSRSLNKGIKPMVELRYTGVSRKDLPEAVQIALEKYPIKSKVTSIKPRGEIIIKPDESIVLNTGRNRQVLVLEKPLTKPEISLPDKLLINSESKVDNFKSTEAVVFSGLELLQEPVRDITLAKSSFYGIKDVSKLNQITNIDTNIVQGNGKTKISGGSKPILDLQQDINLDVDLNQDLNQNTNLRNNLLQENRQKIKLPFNFELLKEQAKADKSIKFSKALAQAYTVQIRRRGKFMDIASGLPRGRALEFGATKTMKTLGQTFRLLPKGTTTLRDVGFRVPSSTFTRLKRPTADIEFVERRGKTLKIGTGEIGEIMKAKKMKRGRSIWR